MKNLAEFWEGGKSAGGAAIVETVQTSHAEVPAVTCSRRQDTPGAVIARFMELRGHRVVEGCGALWHGTEGGFLMSFPYNVTLSPDCEGLDRMMRSVNATGVRFPSANWPGLSGGIYLFSRRSYDVADVHTTFRRRVRRGLEQLRVRLVEPAELLVQGLQLNHDTLARQGRDDREFADPAQWKRLVEALRRCQGVEAIGAFWRDRLSAYIIYCREGRGLHILHQMSRTEDLPKNPNHTLTFEFTRRAMEDPGIDFASYGLLSLVNTPGLHQYKLDFGYEVHPFNVAFRIHPGLAPILNTRPVRKLVKCVRALRPRDQRLERLDTVLQGAALSKEWLALQPPERTVH